MFKKLPGLQEETVRKNVKKKCLTIIFLHIEKKFQEKWQNCFSLRTSRIYSHASGIISKPGAAPDQFFLTEYFLQ